VKRLWELLALLIIGALLLEAALSFIQPLIPYMVAVALMAVVGGYVYNRNRMW
jgi:uncharacterized membrane protein YccC